MSADPIDYTALQSTFLVALAEAQEAYAARLTELLLELEQQRTDSQQQAAAARLVLAERANAGVIEHAAPQLAGRKPRQRVRAGRTIGQSAAWLFDEILKTAVRRPDGRLVSTASNQALTTPIRRAVTTADALLNELECAELIMRSGFRRQREIEVVAEPTPPSC